MAERTILVVEDNPDDVRLLTRAFRKAEVTSPVVYAADGQEAIEMLTSEAEARAPLPDVILLDLKLPRRSGFEVLEWLKADERMRQVPVVILTSSAGTSDLSRAYDLGANSYLVKPVDNADLTQMVANIRSYWLELNRISYRSG